MRNNQFDLDNYFSDLNDWQKDIKKKDTSKNLRATK